jgi:hypothetical protein
MKSLRGIVLSGILLAAALPAEGVLVVFSDGRLLRVETYQLEDEERIALSLPGGGTITIPLELVDRIVDEEYERPQPGAAASTLDAGPRRSIRAFEGKLPASALFSKEILEAATAHRVDPVLIAAVIKAESNFDPSAVSRKGARGLMQLMPATARRLGVSRAFDPLENIRGGTAYLAELADRFGETAVELILAAYNAGERAVEEYGGIPPYRETRAYVKRVTALWNDARAARPAS